MTKNKSITIQELITRFKKIQDYFDDKFPQLKGEYKILARLGKITEELGELNSAVHGELLLHRAEKQAKHKHEDVEKEWADVFNTVMLFGLVMDIDMEKALDEKLIEIYKRYKISDK